MSDPTQEDVISLVNSLFEVSQFNREMFSLEFRVNDHDFKSKFDDLAGIV